MQFSFLTVALLAGAAWYAWRAWSAVQAGVVEARLLPLPGLKVQRLERDSQPAAFRRAIAIFLAFAAACALLALLHALLHALGLLQGFWASS